MRRSSLALSASLITLALTGGDAKAQMPVQDVVGVAAIPAVDVPADAGAGAPDRPAQVADGYDEAPVDTLARRVDELPFTGLASLLLAAAGAVSLAAGVLLSGGRRTQA
jgi:hypothetical protein